MGISVDAHISFGVHVKSRPWEDVEEDVEEDEEEWWLKVSGFVPKHENPFDSRGQWKEGLSEKVRDEMFEASYNEKEEWLKNHPFPIEVVWGGCDDEEDYIFALPGTVIHGNWESPLAINTGELIRDVEFTCPGYEAWKEFMEKYSEGISEAKWYLTARRW